MTDRATPSIPGLRSTPADRAVGTHLLRGQPRDDTRPAGDVEHALTGLELGGTDQHLGERPADRRYEAALVVLRRRRGAVLE